MDEVASNTCDVKEASSGTESSDEETMSKLAALSFPNASLTRKGIFSNRMEQMMLLDQMGLRRLKQDH